MEQDTNLAFGTSDGIRPLRRPNHQHVDLTMLKRLVLRCLERQYGNIHTPNQ
jgi:hypothetical protein